MSEEPSQTVKLPPQLLDQIKERLPGTGFTSVESYVLYVLRQVLASTQKKVEETHSEEDEEKVKEQLRTLGYIK